MNRFAVWGLMVVCLVSGCGKQVSPPREVPPPPGADAPAAKAPDGPAVHPQRRIIYTSQIEIVVEELSAAHQRLQELIKSVTEAGGYLARQEVTGRSGFHRQSSWTIRVPLSQFDGFVAEVEKLGELQRHTREAQDVTEAYADLEARLRNKESSEARLLSHLEKTGELKDTLDVERELSRVRGEVEQLQGQLNLLKNKTELATVILTLHEREHYTPPTAPNFTTEIQRTFAESWRGLVLAGKTLILLTVGAAPWIVVGAVLWLVLRTVRGRRKSPMGARRG